MKDIIRILKRNQGDYQYDERRHSLPMFHIQKEYLSYPTWWHFRGEMRTML